MSKAKEKGWQDGNKTIATNKRARRDYDVEEVFEAGIVLTGTEVKSLRSGKLQFKDAYAGIKDGEAWLMHAHIDEYSHANRFNHSPTRPRKLLLHRREITRLWTALRLEGYTLIPLRFYFKKSWVKVEIGLCRGKKKHDQRQDIAKREAKRQIDQAMRRRR